MNFQSDEVLSISIEIEKALGKLYRRFGDLFPEESDLWRTLSQEEQIHILLLKDTNINTEGKPFESRIHELNEVLNIILRKLENYRNIKSCNKFDAFEDAIEIEAAKAKIHLDIAKIEKIGKEALKAFLQLNRRDNDNLNRLKSYAYSDKKMSFAF